MLYGRSAHSQIKFEPLVVGHCTRLVIPMILPSLLLCVA